MKIISNFYDGKFIKSESTDKLSLYRPTTGEEYAHIPITTDKEFQSIIDKMKIAQASWANTPITKRSSILFKFKNLIEKNFDDIARIISEEHGKVFSDAKGSLQRGLEVVDFACGIPHLLKGNHSINVGTNVDSFDIKQPLGLCAGITPFNFPAMVPMWMFPISIACGNAFMLKPSEKVPQCSLKLGELLNEAGLPENVLTIVNGDKSVVDKILQSPDISSVSFFPNEDSQLLVALIRPTNQLQKIFERVDEVVTRIGFGSSLKTYKPHITLGRFKDKSRPHYSFEEFSEINISSRINILDIYESEFDQGKTNYNLLRSFEF